MSTMYRRQFIIGTLAISAFSENVLASSDILMVYRTESCGCCGEWVKRMSSKGLKSHVNLVSDETLISIKSQIGIPIELSSCHSATIGKYFIEGHVPATDILRLLIDKPKAKGLCVPGMPIGSPGMEMGNNKEHFETLLVFENGETQVFNRHV